MRGKEEMWETKRFQLENRLRDYESETQRNKLSIANLEVEKQAIIEESYRSFLEVPRSS